MSKHRAARIPPLTSRRTLTYGDTASARSADQDFSALWKDADPDLPLLKQAKDEYERLH
jgi:hypothetical protein